MKQNATKTNRFIIYNKMIIIASIFIDMNDKYSLLGHILGDRPNYLSKCKVYII